MHVLTRAPAARELALELGAASAGDATTSRPSRWTRRSCSRPVGDLVPVALGALDRGGTLAVAGIHLTDIPALNYERDLFQERTLRSVTANTRADGRGLPGVRGRAPPAVTTTPYPLARADQALARPGGRPGERGGGTGPGYLLAS